jgi:hypothetical protein
VTKAFDILPLKNREAYLLNRYLSSKLCGTVNEDYELLPKAAMEPPILGSWPSPQFI